MKLTSLGTPRLAHTSDVSAVVLARGKPFALLVYLSAAPKRSASRSALVSLLWADLEPDAAKHALRQTIWYLKKQTQRELVIAEDDTLRLSADVSVDRDEFLSASKRGDHQRVVDLYAGPFVPSFAAPGGAGFEEWASLERRRLLEVFRHAAEAVVARQLATGHARDAIPLARRLRDEDVNNESGWRLLIEACVSANDLLLAKSESEALRQLAEHDEIELEPATRASLRSIGASAVSDPVLADSLSPTLVGREEVFASLLKAWERTKSGKPTRIHLTARAGVGKTRVLRDLATRIRGMRGRVITIGGSLGTRDIEYAVAGDLASGLASLSGRQAIAPASAATLVDLNPSLSTWFDRPAKHAPREDLLRARTLAVRELMAAVSFEHPVAILIDDLHWWDEPSTALLSAAIDGLGDSRLLVVTAGRPEARRTALVATNATEHLSLEPLTASQVEELVLGIASLPAESWASVFANDLWRASRGSPLLVLGMLRHLEERSLLHRIDGGWKSSQPEALSAELQQGDVLRTRIIDLDRADLWLLTLLAAGGSTLSQIDLVISSERGEKEVVDRMASLEGRGFVVRDGEGWRAAHDEIAEEVMRLAPAESASRAAGRLGRALAAPPLDESRARRAAQLLRHRDDTVARVDLFRAFGSHRYSLGDRRSVSALAADLIGATAAPAEVAELRRGSPVSWRLGLVSPARLAVALIGILAVFAVTAIAVTNRATPQPPDAVLALVFADSTGRVSIESVDIRQAGWSPQDTLVPQPWPAPDIVLSSGNGFSADYSSLTGALITTQSVHDSGTIDLFLYRPGEPVRSFLPGFGDDGQPAFSPDGRMVAYSTARWDPLMHYDIAMAGIDDSVPRQLTSGPSSDGRVRWSPDGSRIAFGRSNWGARPNEICIIEISSDHTRCWPTREPESDGWPLGWLDADHLVVLYGAGAEARLSILQWSTGDLRLIVEGVGGEASVSPDATWLFCLCGLGADGLRATAILPIAAPSLVRPVRIGSRASRILLYAFWLSSRASITPSTVSIASQPFAHAGVPVQMRAAFRDGRGNSLSALGGARWRVTNPLAGSIDSLRGILTASGGTSDLTVVVSAGAGVSDSATIVVTSESAQLVIDEQWDDGLSRWMRFGSPSPTVSVDSRSNRAFLNNGDGSFESGAISRFEIDPSRGAAIDAEVTTPITLPQWQVVRLALRTLDDTAILKTAEGVNDTPRFAAVTEWCAFDYPQEGRLFGPRRVASIGSREFAARATMMDIGGGRTWRIRVQLFPDGRCGVAVNGKPVGIVDGGAAPTGMLRAQIAGNSYRTRVAVGRVRVYAGVLTDIEWGEVGRRK